MPEPVGDYTVRIQSPALTVAKGRMILTNTSEVLLYEDRGSTAPLVSRSKYVDFEPPLASNLPGQIVMEDGTRWDWWVLGGCGCNSMLSQIPLAHDLAN